MESKVISVSEMGTIEGMAIILSCLSSSLLSDFSFHFFLHGSSKYSCEHAAACLICLSVLPHWSWDKNMALYNLL